MLPASTRFNQCRSSRSSWLIAIRSILQPCGCQEELSTWLKAELSIWPRQMKCGSRIRLQEQPFQILRMLLARPGEIVLREELRCILWPDNTVVEFDHGINAAIK